MTLRRWQNHRLFKNLPVYSMGILAATSVTSIAGTGPKTATKFPRRPDFLGRSITNSESLASPATNFIKQNTGLTLNGMYKGFVYGNVYGGKDLGAAYNQSVELTGIYDFGFLTRTLNGLTLTGALRWREGHDPNQFVGATKAMQPSNVQSGRHFRAMRLYATYTTPNLFGIKEFLTISGGWGNPYDFFLQQPLSKMFVNNTFESAKGLGANIPWTSSYAAWGGYLKIKPTDWAYAQAGLYMAIPEATADRNHGLYFRGSQMPGKPNGLYAIAETGFTPKIGPTQLPGKYAFGCYWFGVRNSNMGSQQPGQNGFYWQIDQQLYRAPSNAYTIHSNTPSSTASFSEKGLSFFSIFTYAPQYNNQMPFYFHVGLVYQGLIPTRENDRLGIAYGYGSSSDQFADIKRSKHLPYATRQSVLEIDYDLAITKWLSFRPFYQLIINPAADNTVKNANLLGFAIYVKF